MKQFKTFTYSNDKVILYSVQDRKNLFSILYGTYKPAFKYTKGNLDKISRSSYNYMLKALSLKTGKEYKRGKDSCIWAWYQNPYFLNNIDILSPAKEKVVITFEIPIKDVVFSDFDKWNRMYIDGNKERSVVNYSKIRKDMTVQAVCWGIPKGSIISVESFNKHIKYYNKCVK